jgi:hypothetical protein
LSPILYFTANPIYVQFHYSRELMLQDFTDQGITMPDGAPPPDWILSLLSLLTGENICGVLVWRDVLNLWLQLEQLGGYAIGNALSEIPDLFPDTALGWFNNRRSVNWRPRCDDYGGCEVQVHAAYRYWRYLQPSWRVDEEGVVGGDAGDFSALCMSGLDGWPNILVAFFFAAGDFWAGNGTEVSDAWICYVQDIKIAMGGILAQGVIIGAS